MGTYDTASAYTLIAADIAMENIHN
jgi:hypothetical protein